MPTRPYTELECFVLGVTWQLGPCSPYDIRQHLTASPSTQWSASAGAIYPLVRKLEKHKLLKARDQSTGLRPRRMYVITAAGKKVLRAWIGPPLAREAVTVAHDPLRTRVRFLGVMTPSQRQAWVRAARQALDEVERRVHDWHGTYGEEDPFLALVTRNGELDVQSRQAWLREVAAAVGLERAGPPGGEPVTSETATPTSGHRRSAAGRGG